MAEKIEQGKSASYRYREQHRFAAEPIPAPGIVKKVANPGLGSAGKSVLLTMSSGSRFALFDFLGHSGASPHQIRSAAVDVVGQVPYCAACLIDLRLER